MKRGSTSTRYAGWVIGCVVGAAAAASAHAQSSVTIYGILDATASYTTHFTPDGGRSLQGGDGMITGSRLGYRAVEDLGGGMRAKFNLESGISPDTGSYGQGGRSFGRISYLGLEGPIGEVRLGRQYTVGHEVGSSFDSMGFANLTLLGYQGLQYTGLRFDNMVRASTRVGDFNVIGGYAFGESPAGVSSGASQGAALVYDKGPLHVGAVYQQQNTVSTYFSTTVPTSRQTYFALGGNYDMQWLKLFASITESKMEQADYHNRIITVGFHWYVTPTSRLIGNFMFDRLDHGAASGNHSTDALVYEYFLSKRTNVYVGAYYINLTGAWMTVGTTKGFPQPFYDGFNTRSGAMVGLRNTF
jgi:predicted porin